MRQTADGQLLPDDIDAEPLVRAAAVLRPAIRDHRDALEREQRLPKPLVEQFHAAGFYRLVRPRALGGLQTDPLTYLRVVELLDEVEIPPELQHRMLTDRVVGGEEGAEA